MGGERIGFFVVVGTFPAEYRVVHTDVTVRLHASGGDKTSARVNHRHVGGFFNIFCNAQDFSVVSNENGAVFQVGTCHGFYVSVFDE